MKGILNQVTALGELTWATISSIQKNPVAIYLITKIEIILVVKGLDLIYGLNPSPGRTGL